MKLRNKKGQQEMVGFVLIVVLVMVGLMVFLIISVRNSPEPTNSLAIENLLASIMKHTTECAIVFEPQFDNFEDLFKSCYEGDICSNLEQSACEYLNESLRDVVDALMDSEATVVAYQLDFFVRDDEGQQGLLRIVEGNCTGPSLAAQRSIVSGSESLVVRIKTCNNF
ncbi:hypothetical protein KAJ38_02725 [Candidatus Pacearchaeota archaeon]|nr:hypothetical protein [Candidatus Pacearchaeota archaeon]